jgi:cytochrome c-type biogenesis protein CcmH/NrfG
VAIRITAINTKFQSGANVNAEITAFLSSLQGKLPTNKGVILFNAFSPAAATREEAISFYDTLLRSVEANAGSAPFLRRILDQKTKLQ